MKLARRVYPWHSLMGICLSLAVFALSFSGAFAVFKDELSAWADGALTAPAAFVPLDRAFERLVAALPEGQKVRRLELPTGARGYELRSQEGRRYHFDSDGRVVTMDSPHGLANFLVNYHTRFFMGHPGRWIIGGVGIALLLSIVTGILMHRRFLRQMVTLRLKRGNPRLAYSDSHKAAGLWGLPFHLGIAVTGAWLGLYALIEPGWESPPVEPGVMTHCGASPAPSCLVEQTKRAIPGFEPVFIDFRPGKGITEVRGNLPGQLFRRHEAGVVFKAGSCQPMLIDAPAHVSPARRLDLAAAPLHFGDFAGSLVQWLYALLALLAAGLTVTGVLMWSRRGNTSQRQRRRKTAHILCAGASANVMATFLIPVLGILAAGGIGPSFDGSMRMSDLFNSERAAIVPVFLSSWLIFTLGLRRVRGLKRMLALGLQVSGTLALSGPVAAAVMRRLADLPVTSFVLEPVSVSLLMIGALMSLGGVYLRVPTRRKSDPDLGCIATVRDTGSTPQ